MKTELKDMPNAEYHKVPALGSTVVKSALKSPRAYLRAIQGEFKQTASMALGDAIHAHTLEPHRFEEMYELSTKKNGDNELLPKLDGIMKITPAEYSKFLSMTDALAKCQEFQELVSKAKCIEKSFFTELDGVAFKCRTDFITSDGWIVDLKTVGGMSATPSSPEEFGRSFFDFGYDVGMVLYTNVVEKCIGKKVKGFKFACVDAKQEDSGVKIYTFARGESDWWKLGAKRLELGVAKALEYKDAEVFPVYETVEETDLPFSYGATNFAVENEVL